MAVYQTNVAMIIVEVRVMSAAADLYKTGDMRTLGSLDVGHPHRQTDRQYKRVFLIITSIFPPRCARTFTTSSVFAFPRIGDGLRPTTTTNVRSTINYRPRSARETDRRCVNSDATKRVSEPTVTRLPKESNPTDETATGSQDVECTYHYGRTVSEFGLCTMKSDDPIIQQRGRQRDRNGDLYESSYPIFKRHTDSIANKPNSAGTSNAMAHTGTTTAKWSGL